MLRGLPAVVREASPFLGVSVSVAFQVWGLGCPDLAKKSICRHLVFYKDLGIIWPVFLIIIFAVVSFMELCKKAKILS